MRKAICLFWVLCLYSCINVSTRFPEYSRFVKVKSSYLIASKSCDVEKLYETQDDIVYLVSFHTVNAGYMLNSITGTKYNEVDGNNTKRLDLLSEGQKLISFSIDDFKVLAEDTINLNFLFK